MEFEELQRMWNTQNNQPMYVINADALHNNILSRKRSTSRASNRNELMLIGVNLTAGVFNMWVALSFAQPVWLLLILSVWIFGTVGYVLYHRIRRIRAQDKYDRSMLGDLDHAISDASWQVTLSRIMRWNIVPIALLLVGAMIESEKSLIVVIGVLVFFSFAWLVGGWEHAMYDNKKRRMEGFRKKLADDQQIEASLQS